MIGKDFTARTGTHIAACEGANIYIGDDCMLSEDIEMRSTDSHAIYDLKTRKRINKAKEIRIGDHVWLTAHVRILKGAIIAEHSIVGNSSVVTGHHDTSHAIYAGNPCKLIKQNVDWSRSREEILPQTESTVVINDKDKKL